MYLREGFFGQRLRVLPRPLVREAIKRPVLRRLLVTDAGCFPHAALHGRVRVNGAPETIVMVCTAGVGWVEYEQRPQVRVERGDAVVIPAGMGHRYHADRLDPWTIWWVHLTGEDVDDFTDGILGDSEGIVRMRDVYAAVAAIEEVVTALEAGEATAMLVTAAGAAWRLMAQVSVSSLLGSGESSDRIEEVQAYLRTHLDTKFSVPQLASMAGMSASHFAALFRVAAGTSVKDYLKRLRNARARELLIMSDMSIGEIANAVGYQDALYFSRQFRVVNGVSPSMFRSRVAAESLDPPP